MAIVPTIFDWPRIIPSKQLFIAGGQSVEGAYTSGGVATYAPDPGGRAFLYMEFDSQPNYPVNPLISWVMSKARNGNVFRVPIWRSPQLMTLAELGLSQYAALERTGVPWDNEQPWDNGFGWEFEPGASVTATALEGEEQIVIDMAAYGPVLVHGKVFGHQSVAYLVDDIEYDGTIATVTVAPPLRNDVAIGEFVTFRPKMLAVVKSADDFKALYQPTDIIQPGPVTFVESLI